MREARGRMESSEIMARAKRLYFGKENHSYRPALERFAEKCRYDPATGCVLWTGGTTAGHGNSARYGSFWFEGARWYAHRWSAIHIKGIDLGGNQAGHCCPAGPNTLCVEHVTGQTQLANLVELNNRLKARVVQSAEERQYWLLVRLGFEAEPPNFSNPDILEYVDPVPEWFLPFYTADEITEDDENVPF